ncbi:Uncharacterised protein [Mycobacterium senegalense]|uniref:Uncharacterized protein n=1 Tax=Mycolicibacterium senegalense TaxID=1796 RepID=A0A378SWS6_9MYCO|nr:Uncharacterised protein [Mycolicibacterium senegalense]
MARAAWGRGGAGPSPEFRGASDVGEWALELPDAGLGVVLRVHAQMLAHPTVDVGGKRPCRCAGYFADFARREPRP